MAREELDARMTDNVRVSVLSMELLVVERSDGESSLATEGASMVFSEDARLKEASHGAVTSAVTVAVVVTVDPGWVTVEGADAVA